LSRISFCFSEASVLPSFNQPFLVGVG
jgi:hypothetical protein